MAYKIVSRVASSNYNNCAKIIDDCLEYDNLIESDDYYSIQEAEKYVIKNGMKQRIYYICEKYNKAFDKQQIDNAYLDAGNNWFVRKKFGIISGKWVRLKVSSHEPYDDKIKLLIKYSHFASHYC